MFSFLIVLIFIVQIILGGACRGGGPFPPCFWCKISHFVAIMQHFVICFSACFFMFYSIFSGLSFVDLHQISAASCPHGRGAASRPEGGRREGGSPLSAFVCLASSGLLRTSTFFQLTKFSNSLLSSARLSHSPPSLRPLPALSPPSPRPLPARKKAALLPPLIISPNSPPLVKVWSAWR